MPENIIIEISADAQKLIPVIDQLVKLGQVSEKDAEAFKKITAESQKVADQTVKTTEAVKVSATEQAKATNAKISALEKEKEKLAELERLSKKAADPASQQKFNQAITETKTRITSLNAELSKTPKAIKDSDTAFKSLRTQLLEARNEAVRLAEKFGEFSPQAIAAANAAAKIDDKVKDLNKTIAALNPEQKLGAFLQIGSGIAGAFTAAQAAMGLFGEESEDTQKALLKVQQALALTQGLQSLLGLKDAFRDLRILLGITSAAQTTLATSTGVATAATGAQTVATEGAAVAQTTLNTVMKANPIVAVVAVIGTLVAAFFLLKNVINSTAKEQEELNRQLDLFEQEAEKRAENVKATQQIDPTIRGLQRLIELKEAEGATDIELIKLKIQLNAAEQLYAKTLYQTLAEGGAAQKRAYQDYLDIVNSKKKLLAELTAAEIKAAEASAAIDKIRKEQAQGTPEQLPGPGLKPISLTEDIDEKKEEEKLRKERDRIEQFHKDVSEVKRKALERDAQKEIELEQQKQEILSQIQDQALTLFTDIIKAQFQATLQGLENSKSERLQKFDEEISELQELNKNKIISDGLYEKQKKELLKSREQAEIEANKKIAEQRRKLFLFERTAALAKIAIDTAKNAIEQPGPLGALVPYWIALGALQAGIVLAQPIPQFKKGKVDITGKAVDSDGGFLSMLHPHESVLDSDKTKRFKPTLKAIHENRISHKVLNEFVLEGKSGGVAVIDSRDMRDLKRIGKRNPEREAELIGRSVAKHIKNKSIYSHIRGEWVD